MKPTTIVKVNAVVWGLWLVALLLFSIYRFVPVLSIGYTLAMLIACLIFYPFAIALELSWEFIKKQNKIIEELQENRELSNRVIKVLETKIGDNNGSKTNSIKKTKRK